MGIEPMTSSLPRKRSTPELHRPNKRAGNEIQTRDPQLGRLMLYQLSYSRKIYLGLGVIFNKLTHKLKLFPWGEQDSNLRRRTPAELQSAPVGHFGISPILFNTLSRWRDSNPRPADYKSAALTN